VIAARDHSSNVVIPCLEASDPRQDPMNQSLSSLLISNKLVLQNIIMLLQWPLEDCIINGKLVKKSAVKHSKFFWRQKANGSSKWAVYSWWRNG